MKKWFRDMCLMTVITAMLICVAVPAMALPPRSSRRDGLAPTTKVALWVTAVTWVTKETASELVKTYVVKPVVHAVEEHVINPVVNKVQDWLQN